MGRKQLKYEVIIPEDKRIWFEKLMKELGVKHRDTGFYYVADLEAFVKGTQKPVPQAGDEPWMKK